MWLVRLRKPRAEQRGVLESSVDPFGRSVADSWMVDVGHQVTLTCTWSSVVVLSKHEPTRPIDWYTPGLRHSLVGAFAVWVGPLSAWNTTACSHWFPCRAA